MIARPRPSLALALTLACAGCIIELPDDDSAGVTDDGPPPPPPPPTGLPSDDTGPTPPGDDTGSTTNTSSVDTTGTTGGTTGGGPMGECSENVLLDPSFEEGTPNSSWTEESMVFGTPICDTNCTTEPGAEPYAGDWWVWLGGVDDEPEVGAVSQVVTIEPEMAYLGFWFQIRSAVGNGDDLFFVTIDGDTVFMATDAQMAQYAEYTQIYVDITGYADGGEHEVRFIGDFLGNGLSSFFLDETSLVSCVEPSGTSSSGPGDSGTGSSGSGSSGSGSGSGSSGSSGSGSSSGN